MASVQDILKRVRSELGDLGEPFRQVVVGDDATTWVDLHGRNISTTGLQLLQLTGATSTPLPANAYTLDATNGILQLNAPVATGTSLIIQGTSYSIFADDELTVFVNDAVLQHCHDRVSENRYRGADGFIRYQETPMDLGTLPPVEDVLVALLATIEALWALATDAATDTDVVTAEGTHLSRGQRYNQLVNQINVLTDKYKTMCEQLNVGLGRIQQSTLRRVSRATERLVPVFAEREYDDYQLPERLLPPIDKPNEDPSGVPSPIYGGWW